METKICNICETEKSIDEFLWRNKQKGLKHHSCRLCYKELRKKSYEKNRDYYLNKSSKKEKTQPNGTKILKKVNNAIFVVNLNRFV